MATVIAMSDHRKGHFRAPPTQVHAGTQTAWV